VNICPGVTSLPYGLAYLNQRAATSRLETYAYATSSEANLKLTGILNPTKFVMKGKNTNLNRLLQKVRISH